MLILSFNAKARTYLSYQAGYTGFRTEKMKNADVALKGVLHRIGFGAEVGNFDLEFYYKKGDLNGDFKPDGNLANLQAENQSYGILLAIYLRDRLNLNFGYGWSENQYTIENGNSKSLEGRIAGLGLSNNQGNLSGFLYGVGYDIIKTRHFDLFTKYLYHSNSDIDSSEHTISLGVKFKFNFQLGDIFNSVQIPRY